jgi:hypothetical protein
LKDFIPIQKSIINHWIYQDSDYFRIWFHVLVRTRFSKEPGTTLVERELITTGYGQFIFGRKTWSEQLKIGEQKIRTLLDKLVKSEMITLVSKHNKCTVYLVNNFEKYNQKENQHQDLEGVGVEDSSPQRITSTKAEKSQQLEKSNQRDNQQLTLEAEGIEGDNPQRDNQRITSGQPADNHIRRYIDSKDSINNNLFGEPEPPPKHKKEKYSEEVKEVAAVLKKWLDNQKITVPRDWHLKNYSTVNRLLNSIGKEELISALEWGMKHNYWSTKLDSFSTVSSYLPKYQLEKGNKPQTSIPPISVEDQLKEFM